jgi:hypothetical protein
MRVVTAPISQDAVIKFKNYNSPIYTCMRVDTGPALQDAVIKFESYNCPIYICVLSLGPFRRMQLSNSRIITLRYTHICTLSSKTVRLYVQSGQPVDYALNMQFYYLAKCVMKIVYFHSSPLPPTLCTPLRSPPAPLARVKVSFLVDYTVILH